MPSRTGSMELVTNPAMTPKKHRIDDVSAFANPTS